MSRFIPSQIKARTIDNPEYWQYVQLEIKSMTDPILKADLQTKKFDMGL